MAPDGRRLGAAVALAVALLACSSSSSASSLSGAGVLHPVGLVRGGSQQGRVWRVVTRTRAVVGVNVTATGHCALTGWMDEAESTPCRLTNQGPTSATGLQARRNRGGSCQVSEVVVSPYAVVQCGPPLQQRSDGLVDWLAIATALTSPPIPASPMPGSVPAPCNLLPSFPHHVHARPRPPPPPPPQAPSWLAPRRSSSSSSTTTAEPRPRPPPAVALQPPPRTPASGTKSTRTSGTPAAASARHGSRSRWTTSL